MLLKPSQQQVFLVFLLASVAQQINASDGAGPPPQAVLPGGEKIISQIFKEFPHSQIPSSSSGPTPFSQLGGYICVLTRLYRRQAEHHFCITSLPAFFPPLFSSPAPLPPRPSRRVEEVSPGLGRGTPVLVDEVPPFFPSPMGF